MHSIGAAGWLGSSHIVIRCGPTTGVKFLRSEAEAVAEGAWLEGLGYIIERIGQTSKARIEALVAGAPA